MDVLINKTYRNYDRLCRYSNFPYYYHTLDDKYICGTTSQLASSTPFTLHKISPGDTFDTLALYYYNNPTYFWIICDFNRIQDPFMDLPEGKFIKIPVLAKIQYL